MILIWKEIHRPVEQNREVTNILHLKGMTYCGVYVHNTALYEYKNFHSTEVRKLMGPVLLWLLYELRVQHKASSSPTPPALLSFHLFALSSSACCIAGISAVNYYTPPGFSSYAEEIQLSIHEWESEVRAVNCLVEMYASA